MLIFKASRASFLRIHYLPIPLYSLCEHVSYKAEFRIKNNLEMLIYCDLSSILDEDFQCWFSKQGFPIRKLSETWFFYGPLVSVYHTQVKMNIFLSVFGIFQVKIRILNAEFFCFFFTRLNFDIGATLSFHPPHHVNTQ